MTYKTYFVSYFWVDPGNHWGFGWQEMKHQVNMTVPGLPMMPRITLEMLKLWTETIKNETKHESINILSWQDLEEPLVVLTTEGEKT